MTTLLRIGDLRSQIQTTPTELIPRHKGDGRPRIFPEGGGKGEFYTRTTTFIDCLDDKSSLTNWKLQTAMAGLQRKPELLDKYDPEGSWTQKNNVVESILRAGGASEKADIGTALHEVTEAIDNGREPPMVPPDLQADVDAYRRIREELNLTWSAAELFGVNDHYKVAGTMDRVGYIDGKGPVVMDVKGLALDTPLPTPDGWTTMRHVDVGDYVLGSDGRPCKVSHKSEVKMLGCYRVTFDDTSSIICDEEHLWQTTLMGYVHKGVEPTAVRSVTDIRDTLVSPSTHQKWHSIPIAAPLEFPEADLPIDPYTLGVWLGDGTASSGSFSKGVDDGAIADEIRRRGLEVSEWRQTPGRETVKTWNVIGLAKRLREEGLKGMKHVPDVYLRGSVEQRLALLRGLMDTDGTYNTARKQVAFTSCDKALACAVKELVLSLGERVHMNSVERTGFGKTVTSYDVKWRPAVFNPFILPRKADQVNVENSGMNKRRLIVSVEKVPTVPTACIAVESEDRMYLAGESMIPTHNTSGTLDYSFGKFTMQVALYAMFSLYDPVSYRRSPLVFDGKPLDQDVGYILWLPQGKGHCEVVPVDLAAGRRYIELAATVREYRRWAARKSTKAPSIASVTI